MKKILTLTILSLFALASCGWFGGNDKENFIEAYKEILVARELYKNEPKRADEAIESVYQKYGFTKKSFKERYFEIARENPREFYEIIDSVRESAKKEILEIEKRKAAKKDSLEKAKTKEKKKETD